ncbi:MAG: GNAT family N-acetyltransferase, partial [Gluconacetobacter diazotrophicus]|nr:GNAT family N-acetyltransferase [Gluconacetobacter diazotrophicus]
MKSRYGLEIRTAAPADVDGLAQLLAACGVVVAAAELAARLERGAAGPGTTLLAAEWGPPSGMVSVHWYATPIEPRPVGRIVLLLVDPERRRQGIGRLLVKAASQAARTAGCDRIELSAAPDRADSAAFCRATGFAEGAVVFGRGLRKA